MSLIEVLVFLFLALWILFLFLNRKKITEKKYKKIKSRTLLFCALGIIAYIILIRYNIKINPDSFIYTSMQKPTEWANIESTIWKYLIVGWIIFIALFIREVIKNKKHWVYKLDKILNPPPEENKDEIKKDLSEETPGVKENK